MSTWMVVEDEPDIYEVLLAMFEVWGIAGVAFVDGGEAISWIEDVDAGRVQSDLPELAILDIRLPQVSGPEVGARLRQSPRLKNMVIVLITAYRLHQHEEENFVNQAGADMFLYKPLPRPDEFRKLLDKTIAARSVPVPAQEAQDVQETQEAPESQEVAESDSEPSTTDDAES